MANRRRWPHRVSRVFVSLVVLVLTLCVAAKYWLVPAAVRWRLGRQVPKYWAGEATIDRIEFNFFSPIRLRGLCLRDDAGRQWLGVGSVTLTLRDFPGLHPALTGIVARDIVVRGHVVGGKLAWPLKRLPRGRAGLGRYVDLRNVSAGPISVGLADDRGNEIAWEDIEFKLVGPLPAKDPHYSFSLARRKKDRSQTLVCEGATYPATWKSRAELAISHRLDAREIEGILAILGAGGQAGSPAGAVARRVGPQLLAGLLEGAARIEAVGADPNTLRGRGRLRLADVRAAHGFGRLGRLLADAQIEVGNHVRTLEAAFRIRGTRILFDRLDARHNIGSLSVEPGGWIDLSPKAERQVDLYLVAVANDQVKNILSKVPVARWGVVAADKLTRVHVSGRWRDPPKKLIRKEPIRDLAAGTAQVLRGIGGAGADVGQRAARTIGELLKIFGNKPGGPGRPPP